MGSALTFYNVVLDKVPSQANVFTVGHDGAGLGIVGIFVVVIIVVLVIIFSLET